MRKKKLKVVSIVLAFLVLTSIATPVVFADSLNADQLLQQAESASTPLKIQWDDALYEDVIINLITDPAEKTLSSEQWLRQIKVYDDVMGALQGQSKTMADEKLQSLLYSLEYSLTEGTPGAFDEVNRIASLIAFNMMESDKEIGSAIVANIEKGKRAEVDAACMKILDRIKTSSSPERYQLFYEQLNQVVAGREVTPGNPQQEPDRVTTPAPKDPITGLSPDDIGSVSKVGSKGNSIKDDTKGTLKGGTINLGKPKDPVIDPTKEQSWVLVKFSGSEDHMKINVITEDDKVGFSDVKQIAGAMAWYANENNVNFYYMDDDVRYMVSYNGELFIKEYIDAVMTYEETINYFNTFGLVDVIFEKVS